LAHSGAIAFEVNAMKSFFEEMRRKKFPAVHHSRQYEENYSPAYRVILKKFAPAMN
jgi:hypothetical protein